MNTPLLKTTFALICIALCLAPGCHQNTAPVSVTTPTPPTTPAPAITGLSYATHMQPIISQHCAVYGCHVPGERIPGNFTQYSTMKPFLENGEVFREVVTRRHMPPKYKLNDATVDSFRYWIQAGYPEN